MSDYTESSSSKVSDSNTVSECPSRYSSSRSRLKSRPSILRPSHHHINGILNFYEDDEVCRLSPKGKIEFGLVKAIDDRNQNTSDFQIQWAFGNKTELQNLHMNDPEKYANIRIVDRNVQKGDVVQLDGRGGEVVGVNFVASLKSMEKNAAIVEIPCESLEPVLAYHVGQRLAMDGWIGVITSVEVHASLMLPNGKSCVVNLNKLSKGNKLYPGSQVQYSIDEYVKAGAVQVDSGENLVDIFNEENIPAFVFFLKVESVDIDWKVQLPIYQPKQQPLKTVGRLALKQHAKILQPPMELVWGSDESEIYENYYRYSVQTGDMVLVDCNTNLEKLLISQLFPDSSDQNVQQTVGINNVSFVVRVLRTTRVANVKWNDTGKVEKIQAASLTYKHTFNEPYHQIVQKILLLAPSSPLRFGVVLSRTKNDIIFVQWFEKSLDASRNLIILDSSDESKFDLEPHFLYGNCIPGATVYRSSTCKIVPALFSFGTVQQVTAEGHVIVLDAITKRECSLLPFEIYVVSLSSKSIQDVKSVSNNATKLHDEASGSKPNNKVVLKTHNTLFSPKSTSNVKSAAYPSSDNFEMLQSPPEVHHFYGNVFPYSTEYMQLVSLNINVLTKIFSERIWVKAYQDRKDLYSAMIAVGKECPYEDGLFHFDIQLPQNYPSAPPQIYLTTLLSPDVEANIRPKQIHFNGSDSDSPVTILKALLTIQKTLFYEDIIKPIGSGSSHKAAILNKSKHFIDQHREINSRAILNVLDLLFRLFINPPSIWANDVNRYIHATIPKISTRLRTLISQSYSEELTNPVPYHLLPMSRGFIQAIQNRIEKFRELSQKMTSGP